MENTEIELLQVGRRKRSGGKGGKGGRKELRCVMYMYKFSMMSDHWMLQTCTNIKRKKTKWSFFNTWDKWVRKRKKPGGLLQRLTGFNFFRVEFRTLGI